MLKVLSLLLLFLSACATGSKYPRETRYSKELLTYRNIEPVCTATEEKFAALEITKKKNSYPYLKYSKDLPKFKEILNLSKEFVESNGAKFYFVYLPGYERYSNTLILPDASQKYNKVIKIIKNLKIPIIDINKDLFEKHKNPLSLFPSASHHYNELGYKLVADTIFKKIFEPESLK